MAATLIRNTPNPLLLPEIVEYVVDNICMGDLVSCACVNSLWNVIALKKLYKGSLNDMQYRTPHIGRLNNLLIASRERFSQNMSFVKHLLLAPKTPTIDDAARPNTNRLACSEEFLPLRRRLDAERLLRPQGSRLVSLTIPFEIDEDWSLISDLLLSPTIEYLAVDNFYCELLMASSNKSAEPITPADKFSKLKALTIYRSESSRDNKLLFHLIRSCNLHFFHFEERSRDQMTPIEISELLISLQRQQNLKALVLIIPGSSCSAAIRMARRKQSKLWPNLKALYLGMGDEHWLEQIPDFKELQILNIQEFISGPRIINSDVISKIEKCQELRVIDVYFRECNDIEALLDIAHGCPLFQMLRVLHRRLGGRLDPMNTKFSDLLRALPHLEFLELDFEVSDKWCTHSRSRGPLSKTHRA